MAEIQSAMEWRRHSRVSFIAKTCTCASRTSRQVLRYRIAREEGKNGIQDRICRGRFIVRGASNAIYHLPFSNVSANSNYQAACTRCNQKSSLLL
jgi:hypothetical protein